MKIICCLFYREKFNIFGGILGHEKIKECHTEDKGVVETVGSTPAKDHYSHS